MKLSMTLIRGLSITALAIASLFLAAACSGESEPDSTPTPVPTPTPDVDDFLTKVSANVAAMSTAKFGMIDETETGALFFGTTFKSMEAVVEAPSNFRMLVEVEAPGFGFLEIEIVKVGDQAVMKFSKDAPWLTLPPDEVPFNFAGLSTVFADLPDKIQNAAVTGMETIQGSQTIRVEGSFASEELLDLITSADPGHTVTLTLWIDETEFELRQIRLAGQIYDDDAPETTRLLTIDDINAPVDIELPQ